MVSRGSLWFLFLAVLSMGGSLSVCVFFEPSWLTLVQTAIDICDSGRSSRSFFWVSNEVFDAFSLLESVR